MESMDWNAMEWWNGMEWNNDELDSLYPFGFTAQR